MTTISGPVTIGATNTNWASAVTLPFTASNWSSTYNSGLVTTGEALSIKIEEPTIGVAIAATHVPVKTVKTAYKKR